jgi:Fic family protein
MESVGSARIEGNNTTIAGYIEERRDKSQSMPQPIKEISNIEKAIQFIEENIEHHPINKAFISEIHRIVVGDLCPKQEGDIHPGDYRTINVSISNSAHTPPDFMTISSYMDELIDFIEESRGSKYDLLKIAIAHHRFTWIHPFRNGNGRTVRLLTYAMLIKLGFNINRIINPTAIFCSNRDDYYNNLTAADTGTDKGILQWCTYVLNGLQAEFNKIDKLSNYDFLKNEILFPAIEHAQNFEYITKLEAQILLLVIQKQIIQSSDLVSLMPGSSPEKRSRMLKKLINDKRLLKPIEHKSRKYILDFKHNNLIKSIIWALGKSDFLPEKDANSV